MVPLLSSNLSFSYSEVAVTASGVGQTAARSIDCNDAQAGTKYHQQPRIWIWHRYSIWQQNSREGLYGTGARKCVDSLR